MTICGAQATTCDAQAARSGLGVRQERSSHHSHHSQRPQNPEWVRMSLGTLEGPERVRPETRQGQERARQWPGATRMGLRRSMRLTSPPRAAPERDGVRSSRASSSPSISHG